jgi:hypothetical protein
LFNLNFSSGWNQNMLEGAKDLLRGKALQLGLWETVGIWVVSSRKEKVPWLVYLVFYWLNESRWICIRAFVASFISLVPFHTRSFVYQPWILLIRNFHRMYLSWWESISETLELIPRTSPA